MVVTVDISNTQLCMSCLEDGEVFLRCRSSSDESRTADEYAVTLELMARQHDVDIRSAEGAILSSVVPNLTGVLRRALEILTGHPPMVVGPGVKTGLNIRLDDPSELGSDFVAASVAALESYSLPCVTVQMDTAASIGVLDEKGSYIGGMIAPGLLSSSTALSSGAARLPNVSLEAPGHIICKNTADCMKSGIIYGAAAMLDGLLMGVEEELGQGCSVVATGTWAETVIPYCRKKGIVVEKDLLARGLWLIYQRNKKK